MAEMDGESLDRGVHKMRIQMYYNSFGQGIYFSECVGILLL